MRDAPAGSNRDTSATAETLAHELLNAFVAYHDTFRVITRRARSRFEAADWVGAQVDATDRLALYRERIGQAVERVRSLLDGASPAVWVAAKTAFSAATRGRADAEIAETFFNSAVRRVQETVGADPLTTYVASAVGEHCSGPEALYATIDGPDLGPDAFEQILAHFPWHVPYADRAGDARRAAAIAAPDFLARCHGVADRIEVLHTPFYRNKGAYLVARIWSGRRAVPLIIALGRAADGIVVDAVLPTPDEASIVFGFSWSYFRVDTPDPAALVAFLGSVMPLKRVDELYTAIGYNRHGKTVLYRNLMQHLQDHADARFAFAEGDEGTVMSVFTLPSFNIVFKLIKDRFAFPKTTTRRAVRDRYHFVFIRDRVGRLADAQEFEFLDFPLDRFSAPLLEHLVSTCGETVRVVGDRVILQHAYTERRVTPLNLYLRAAAPAEALHAVLDYGQAIKDLAGTNIFTGDMLFKNFGVTRHGRVICYDYDELALLTDCRFRNIPQPVHEEDEWSAEPTFFVGENDVFPEEFGSFLVPPGTLHDAFLAAHGDLLDVHYWRDTQTRVRTGEILDIFPYLTHRRLARAATSRVGTTTKSNQPPQ
jgi:isocitrate dehydrogenase kinase/phosphatase